MKYIISLVFITALLPGVGGSIEMGFFYMTPLRMALLLLPVIYIGERLLGIRRGSYYLKSSNMGSILFVIIWFLYSLLTVFWVKDLDAWKHGEYFIGLGVWTVLLFDMADLKEDEFTLILKAAHIAIIVHNIVGWYEVVTHDYLFLPPERIELIRKYGIYYPISTMLNQNDFALVLIFGLCTSVFFFKISKKKSIKIFNFLLFLSNILLIICTDSRLGIAGMIIALIVMGIFLIKRRYKLYLLGTGLAALVISIVAMPQIYLKLLEKVRSYFTEDLLNPLVNTDAVRLNLIRNGIVFLRETFGFGVGTGNTEYWMQTEPVYYVRGVTNMHNWWIEILTNFGVLIFVLYIAFFSFLLYSLYQKYKKAKVNHIKMMCVCAVSFMSAFVISCISSSSNWGKEWLWILWSFLIALQGYSDAHYSGATEEDGHEAGKQDCEKQSTVTAENQYKFINQ